MSTKNYLGNGWENTQYELINVSVNLEKLKALPVNEYGDVRITVARMKEPNAKSKATHTVYENDYTKVDKTTGEKETQNSNLPF